MEHGIQNKRLSDCCVWMECCFGAGGADGVALDSLLLLLMIMLLLLLLLLLLLFWLQMLLLLMAAVIYCCSCYHCSCCCFCQAGNPKTTKLITLCHCYYSLMSDAVMYIVVAVACYSCSRSHCCCHHVWLVIPALVQELQRCSSGC